MILRRRPHGALSAALLVSLVIAACGTSTTPSPSPTSAAPAPTPEATGATAIPVVSPSATSPGGSPGASPEVAIDPTLLSVLPATVGGQQINEVPETEAELVTDQSLVRHASSLAVALGINVTTGDFAYVAVIQLKPLVFSNAFYLSWRQSYDQGACSQSGGFKSATSTTIAGRQVFVGTCIGGALTYHVHLPGPDRLVSITSVGTAGYGVLVLGSLKP